VKPLFRRLITIPLYLGFFVVALVALPLLLPLAALVDVVRGTPLAIARALLFFTWYLGCEAIGIVATFALWLARSVTRVSWERYLRWHFLLKCWWARQLVRGAGWIFGLRIETEGDEDLGPGPFLLFMRHASTADTMLTSAILSDRRGIDFRHVIKVELLWDPCLDIVGNRLPNYFVDRESPDSAREIAGIQRLTEDLGTGEGVMIYPEGTRFTEAKRARILDKFAEKGDADLLERARALRNVLPPRLGGPLGLLQAAPDADVLFCAHVGFDGIQSFNQFLSGGLVNRTVRITYWRVPPAEVPDDRDAQIDWLFEHWHRIDDWVGVHKKPGE
jgi:1-acyl-sn-glycerol-3-phosphate acyltransferase